MSTKELILKKISHIEDESILKDLLQMIELELTLQDEIVTLSGKEKAAIDVGLQDIEDGNVFTDEEARKIVDEWLKTK